MSDFSLEQIEAYLSGGLDDTDRSALEQQMERDSDFKKEVEDHRLIFDGLRGMEMELFKEEVNGWETEIQQREQPNPPQKTIKKFISPLRLIAAAIVLLIIAGAVFIWANHQYDSENLAYANYDLPIDATSRKGGTPALQALFLDDNLNPKTLKQSITYLEAIPKDVGDYISNQYYLAHLYFLDDRLTDALNSFQRVVNSSDTRHLETAEWMIAIIYLKSKNADAAKKQLEDIAKDDSHSFQKKAQDLMNDLGSIWYGLVN